MKKLQKSITKDTIKDEIRKFFETTGLDKFGRNYLTVCHVSSPEWGCVSVITIGFDDLRDYFEYSIDDDLLDIVYDKYSSKINDLENILEKYKKNLGINDFTDEIRGSSFILKFYITGEWEWLIN